MITLEDYGIVDRNSIKNYKIDPSSKYGKGGYYLEYFKDLRFAGVDKDLIPQFWYNNKQYSLPDITIWARHERVLLKYELEIGITIFTNSFKATLPLQGEVYTCYVIELYSKDTRRKEFSIDEATNRISFLSSRLFSKIENGLSEIEEYGLGSDFITDDIKYRISIRKR